MTSTPDGYFQTAVDELAPGRKIELAERFDLVIGSGRKAQTYLYWKGEDLFELPVSFWVQGAQWINSPGYPDGSLHFDRAIVPRCLECHGNSFQPASPPANRYIKASLETGIGCERCHGPGRAHVALYSASTRPPPGAPRVIVNPASLPRALQIDTCAICHAGAGKPLAPALSFVPGASLARYVQIPPPDPQLSVDVHGNQIQLLERSRCFWASNMTCTTCHNVHKPQRNAAAFSSFCLNCHKAKDCGEFPKKGPSIAGNCVDCHMPLKSSEALFSNSGEHTLKLPVRSHQIAIYPPPPPTPRTN